jgi:hypothetical protein
MRHLDEHKRILPADGLQTALKAVREDDALALPRPQLYDRVMRAWDTRQQHRKTPRSSTLWLAAAASVALVLTWSSSQSRLDNGTGDAAAERAIAVSSDGAVLLSPDVLMDDASSFQYVRLSLAPRTMAALGIPVVNPADDEPIAVEALIGLDGIPRSIRYAQVRQESQ